MRHDRPMTLVFARCGPDEPRFPGMKPITLLAGDSFHGFAGTSWLLASISQRRLRYALAVSTGRGGNYPMQTDARMWKLVLAYDGTDFHGWQVQPDHLTVQGLLRDALARITGEDVLPQGSGRTDAGVHALGQVASFALAAPIPEDNLVRALNRILPAAIRVLSAARVANDFHARHSAQAKTYEYKIFRGKICPPWQARYVYALNTPLDVEAMQRCARHDFGRARLHLLCRQRFRCAQQCALPLCFGVDGRARSASLSGAWQWFPPSHGAEPGGNLSRSGSRKSCGNRNSGDPRRSLPRSEQGPRLRHAGCSWSTWIT